MRKKIFYYAVIAGLAAFLLGSCRKNGGFYRSKATVHQFSGSTYDFLKSQKGVYDSFLYVVDRVHLTDSLKTGHYTVFAPTNASFQQAIANVNQLRAAQDRPLQYLATVPLNQLDSMVCRYLVRGVIPSDSMKTQDGVDLATVRYGYLMHGKLVATNAEGFVEGGPRIIEYSDKKGVIYTRQWSTSKTVSIDIKTTNGLIDVLERDHVFGFDEFIPRVNPTNSTPYSGVPLPIPGPIGIEQYDKGGERVAYHDDDAKNQGGAYRPEEGVDIEVSGGGEIGYDEGYTKPLEWANYTVNIADSGRYVMLLRVTSPEATGAVHLNLDNRAVTSHIKIPNTGGWASYANIFDTVRLPEGRHVLTLVTDYGDYNIRFMKFMPLDRPYPVPGTIPAADFDTAGGEGVGYHDVDAANRGGAYRSTGVDIEQNKVGGGYDVAYTADGEWLNYTIDVKKTGQYNLVVKVGTTLKNNHFHVEIDQKDVTGLITCPDTGGWQTWMDVSRLVYLEKGVHVMRIYENEGGYNLRSYTFSAVN